MSLKNETPQPVTCEFDSKCSYSEGCHCKGVEEEQCFVLSTSPNLLEVNRAGKPHCSATIFFGFTTSYCRCMKRQKQLTRGKAPDQP